jgi:hypothetical protein
MTTGTRECLPMERPRIHGKLYECIHDKLKLLVATSNTRRLLTVNRVFLVVNEDVDAKPRIFQHVQVVNFWEATNKQRFAPASKLCLRAT